MNVTPKLLDLSFWTYWALAKASAPQCSTLFIDLLWSNNLLTFCGLAQILVGIEIDVFFFLSMNVVQY